ncbi:Phosphotyrosine protein phosphatases superfamily protein [Raphanus sativus]|nr:Phosphotyrosine protein phosphatases superfamily protein [Raphanus sativus]
MKDEMEEDDETQRSSSNSALIGAGGWILFCLTLLYNLLRLNSNLSFDGGDQIDELLMGAVPFRKDVPRLKQLGVDGVTNSLLGKTTYVHCKATIVLCYLIEHKSMTVAAAFEHVRSIRPRVLLSSFAEEGC